ncbi:MAG TPA: integrin alpha, partial [Phytomonospora sp.]
MPASRRTALLTAALLAAGTVLLTAAPARAASCVSAVDNDFDGDGVRDLAVGDPFTSNGGRVVVTHSRTGQPTVIDQSTAGVPGTGVNGDFFGFALASYDRDLDGCDDLVVGGPGETVGTPTKTGSVWIIPGSATGLKPAASFTLTQDTAGFPGANENNDLFGYSLAAGNFGAQRFLAIGVPGETVGATASNAGQVIYQRGSTIAALTQNTAGVPGAAELGDRFGETLAATPQHLVVGTPGEDAAAGLVQVFAHRLTDGRPTHVTTAGQDTAGVSGAGEPGDRFGGQLSAVAFRPSGGGTGTLVAVSATGEDVGGNAITDAGIVHTLSVGT